MKRNPMTPIAFPPSIQLGLIASLLILSISACAPSKAPDKPSPSPEVSVTPSPITSPSPTVTPKTKAGEKSTPSKLGGDDRGSSGGGVVEPDRGSSAPEPVDRNGGTSTRGAADAPAPGTKPARDPEPAPRDPEPAPPRVNPAPRTEDPAPPASEPRMAPITPPKNTLEGPDPEPPAPKQ